ncbi:MAG: GIY-YIG nuclease family protein [Chloroflexi bacterium]|nr:GIY-YIG nuclease family protein [Chloroflexota bacterium]
MVEEFNEFEQQPSASIFGGTAPSTGIVYVLSNVAMPGYIKIGYTGGNSDKDVQDRMKQLDAPGVPRSFDCEYAAVVTDCAQVEKAIHTAFGDFRVRQNREFFEGVEPFRVKAILQLLAIEDVTPNLNGKHKSRDEFHDIESEQPARRRESFSFATAEVPKGSMLEWGDDPEIKCQVANESNGVVFEGEYYSLTSLATKLKKWKHAPPAARYWLYQGETLLQRRDRLEQESNGHEE